MITYNPKDWFTFIFRIHRYETFRQLIPLMLGLAVYAGLITYLELHTFLNADAKELTRSISTIFSILGFTLSLMLVFRTNSAYDRWWEGRKQWGDLTNSSRILANHVQGILPKEREDLKIKIAALIAAFAYALRFHLKGEKMTRLHIQNELDEANLDHFILKVEAAQHQPLVIFGELIHLFYQLKSEGILTDQDMYIIKADLNKLMEVCGACERIKTTPIPFSYSAFLKKFIFFYVMLFPLIYAMHMSYFIIPVTVFILYVLSSIELIAEEIENPFDDAPNDLPTFKMAKNIALNVRMILDGKI
jgi:putative membrane protein